MTDPVTDPVTDSLRERVAAALRHQYLIEDEIGRGGMSVVYRARDLRLERVVAIKVLPPELAHDPAVGSRFTREAQTSAQLAHPTSFRSSTSASATASRTSSWRSSRAATSRRASSITPQRPVEEVRRLLCETSDALAYAHLRGVIHRDIKADNILIDAESGRAMVTDFGIARAMEGGTRLTVTGVAVGTPTYMSPEQAMGERELDGRSDIYSLGVVGYQMLAGRVPFLAGNSMALLLKHVSERPRPIAELRPEAPKQLCDAIERALKKAPEDRWPTASAFRDAMMLHEDPAPSWRIEHHREPMRYNSPVPRGRRDGSPVPRSQNPQNAPARVATPQPGALVLVPPYLASLTTEQRADLRLWHGRITCSSASRLCVDTDLRRSARGRLGIAGFAAGVGMLPPLVISPIVPIFMTVKFWKRAKIAARGGAEAAPSVLYAAIDLGDRRRAASELTAAAEARAAARPRESSRRSDPSRRGRSRRHPRHLRKALEA